MRGLFCALALCAAGCASEPIFKMPMTAAELSSYDSGPALVAYLSQPDATASVCDQKTRGPHVGALAAPMRESLVRGLVDGRVAPELWLQCTDPMIKRAQPDEAASMLDEVGRAYKSLVKNGDFEKTPPMQARAVAMQRLYVERKNRIHDSHEALATLFDDLRAALANHKLGPVATKLGQELLAVLDLEDGKWKGRRVDAALLDDLAASKDEPTLRLFVGRRSTNRRSVAPNRAAPHRRVDVSGGARERGRRRGARADSRRERDRSEQTSAVARMAR